MGLFDVFKKNPEKQAERLDQGLEKTRRGFFERISRAVTAKRKIDEDVLDELEEALILADVGVDTTVKIIERIRQRAQREAYTSTEELDTLIREEAAALFAQGTPADPERFQVEKPTDAQGNKVPYVIMVVGVNGVGKTTTIGKLAHLFKSSGHSVVLGAADTFRAAAVDQLKIWGERVQVPVVEKGMGVDPASVAFAAVEAGKQQVADVVIVDTAGRLHNKGNLMKELAKIKRSMDKVQPGAPHEVLLVLDASTGQNALAQAREFTSFTDVTAMALTKLDGTAKGGVVLAISDQLQVPVKYLGVGEQMTDLQLFDAGAYVATLFKNPEGA